MSSNIFRVRRGQADYNPFRKGKDYSGIHYSLRFQTNQKIMLHGLGFAGLHRKSEGTKFLISIEIKESFSKIKDRPQKAAEQLLTERLFMKEGEPGKEFVLRFSKPILIRENFLIDVSFQIDPAVTSKPVLFNKIKTGECKSSELHPSGVEFDFILSSNAITDIYFSK